MDLSYNFLHIGVVTVISKKKGRPRVLSPTTLAHENLPQSGTNSEETEVSSASSHVTLIEADTSTMTIKSENQSEIY